MVDGVNWFRGKNIIANLIIGILGLLVLVVIQELIRYVLLRMLYMKASPKYKLTPSFILSYLPDVKMNRKSFSTIMLLPSMLVSMMLLLAFINMPNTYIIFIFFILHGIYLFICLSCYARI